MRCRDCGTEIIPRHESVAEPEAAECYSDCYYQCPNETCRVAYSNARDEHKRTKMHRDLEGNVPVPVRDGLREVLSRSLNEAARQKKVLRFGFETSEDAVTWTVFRYLLSRGEVGVALGIERLDLERVLFWGCPWEPDTTHRACDLLRDIQLRVLEEKPKARTEPDVVLLARDLLVFVEVKYLGDNTVQSDYAHFGRYVSHSQGLFAPTAGVAQAGYYELTRNLVTGNLLAAQLGVPFLLINLGGSCCEGSAGAFQQLMTDPDLFRFVSWPALVSRLPQPPAPWFSDYLKQRRLA